MRVDKYFEFMEKAIYGTRCVRLQREEQFGKRYRLQGKGLECPNCKVGFTGRKSGKNVCPACEYEFRV